MRRLKKIASLALCAMLCLALLGGCGGDDSSAGSSRVTDVSITVPTPGSGTDDTSSVPQSLPAGSDVSSSQEESSSSEPQPQPPPEFTGSTPAVSKVEGLTVSVLLKTNVLSAVNYILSTSGEGISTAKFYDYTRRNVALAGAVSHGAAYMVDENGKTAAITLPDTAKPYYLLLNAAENETGTWQTGVTVVKIYDPAGTAPELSGAPTRLADTDTTFNWQVGTLRPTRVYALVGPGNGSAPQPQQIRDGAGYGTIYATYALDTTGDKAPYTAQLTITKGNFSPGSYIIWFVAQDPNDGSGPYSAIQKVEFTI